MDQSLALHPIATRAEIDSLADRIATLDAQENILRHSRFTDLRRFDEVRGWGVQGARSCPHWLSWRLGMDLQTARAHVNVARGLGSLPLIDAAFARGELSYCKVRAMVRVATPQNEASLLDLALHGTGAQLERICRGYSRVVAGTGDEELAHPSDRRRFKRRDLPSGLVELSARLRPEEAAVVLKGIDETLARMTQPASAEEGSSAEERVRVRAARVDAFVAVFEATLATAPPSSVPGRHEVILNVDVATGEGELPDGARVGPETVRRLCCDSPIVTVVERAMERAGPTRSVEVTRKTRFVSGPLRRLLEVRDKVCQFPGCRNHRWLDAHHIEHWADGGESTLDNLALTCRRHHTLLHEGGFSMEATPDGPIFYDPQGRKIERVPSLPDLGADALADLEAERCQDGIGPWTNAPRWDGSPLDLGAAVDAVLRVGVPELFERDPESSYDPRDN
ncbi:MAG: DUF222 domain-containing protein [Planctomycetota bacterium]